MSTLTKQTILLKSATIGNGVSSTIFAHLTRLKTLKKNKLTVHGSTGLEQDSHAEVRLKQMMTTTGIGVLMKKKMTSGAGGENKTVDTTGERVYSK